MREGPAPSGPRSCNRYRFRRRSPDGAGPSHQADQDYRNGI